MTVSDYFLINRDYFESLLIVIGIVSTLVGVPLFYYERRRERSQREHGTYLQVHANYLDYLKLCLEHPDADVWENDPCKHPVTDEEKKAAARKRSIFFSYFISMAEQAFIAYENCSSGPRARQWKGWVEYIDDNFRHLPFQEEWDKQGKQFDAKFLAFMETRLKLIQERQAAASLVPATAAKNPAEETTPVAQT